MFWGACAQSVVSTVFMYDTAIIFHLVDVLQMERIGALSFPISKTVLSAGQCLILGTVYVGRCLQVSVSWCFTGHPGVTTSTFQFMKSNQTGLSSCLTELSAKPSFCDNKYILCNQPLLPEWSSLSPRSRQKNSFCRSSPASLTSRLPRQL